MQTTTQSISGVAPSVGEFGLQPAPLFAARIAAYVELPLSLVAHIIVVQAVGSPGTEPAVNEYHSPRSCGPILSRVPQ